MKRATEVTLRLVVRVPKGKTRELALTAPADLPAKAAASALSESLGLDASRHQALRLASGAIFNDSPLSSLGLRQGDEIMLRELPSNGSARTSDALVDVFIEEPDRPARSLAMPAGEHLLGRESGRVAVEFHETSVSRIHASLGVSPDRIVITDKRSTNKTIVDGAELIPDTATPVRLPATVKIGRSTVRITWRAGHEAAGDSATRPAETANEKGEVLFNRPPRMGVALPAETVAVEAPPADPQKGRIPIATSLVPLLIAVPMALALGNPTFLLFALMSPAIAIASFAEERHRGGSAFRTQSEHFRASVEKAVDGVRGRRAAEVERRLSDAPGPSALADWIRQRSKRLWERRPDDADFMRLRIGLGREPSLVQVSVRSGGNDELQTWAKQTVDTNSAVDGVPISIDLAAVGSVGIVGPKTRTDALARWLIAQAAGLHSPRDLAVAAIAGEDETQAWDWLKWLPQTRPEASPLGGSALAGPARLGALVSEMRKLQTDRTGSAIGSAQSGPRQPKRPWVLLLVDGTAPIDRATIASLLASGLEAGILTVWLAARAEEVPGDCHALIELKADGTASLSAEKKHQAGIAADSLTQEAARDLAISLAPLSDVSAEQTAGGLPERVGLLETLESPEGALDGWMKSAWSQKIGSLGIPIGATADGCLTFDIEHDGLHGLVAGTTGAGKSELLQTIVGALAASYPPSRVTFLLVDYKGGTAFGSCSELPHTVGYVTDLGAGLAERALVSLRAEIKRRERILKAAGQRDFIDLRRTDPECPPSLLIVLDEYATLLKEVPSFVDGVVDVARLGRALGVHLILGTQSPTGVVTQQIQANIGFKIALRTANVEESSTVIDSNLAASISPDTPGRAWIKALSGEPRLFQAAYANTRRAGDPTSSVLVREFGFGRATASRRKDEAQDGTTDLAAIAEAARRVFEASGEREPTRPWLPPMPAVIEASSLAVEGLVAPLGLLDEADRQNQTPSVLDLEEMGGLLVFGAAGSGKTTVLRTAAAGLAERMRPADLHLYGLDFGAGGLRALEALPQCGGVIQGDDFERSIRLLRLLRGEIDSRKSANAGARLPKIVVAIDTYEGFEAVYSKVAYGEWVDGLTRLVADGRAVGVHFLISASRVYGIPSQITSTIEKKIVLRQTEPDHYVQLGVRINPRQIPDLPEGRGFAEGSALIQCAVIGGPDEPEQKLGIKELGDRARERFADADVPSIGRLPTSVEAATLPALLDDSAFLLGIGDSTLAPFGICPEDGHFLIAGPGRSGRTTALVTLAGSIRRSDIAWPIHFLAPRNAPKDLPANGVDRLIVGVDECTEYLQNREWEAIAPGAGSVLMIDDADDLVDVLDGPDFLKILRRRPPGLWVVLSAESEAARKWNEGFKTIRKNRHGLLLRPDLNSDGETLSAKLPRFSAVPANVGRGYLVRREAAELVQVAR